MLLPAEHPLRHPSVKLWLTAVGIALGICALVGVAGAVALQFAYADQFLPGVTVGPLSLGGLSRAEGERLVTQQVNDFLSRGFTFQAQGKTITVPATVAGATPDAVYDLVTIDPIAVTDAAWQVGRHGLINRWHAWLGTVPTPVTATINRERLVATLRESLGQYEQLGRSAGVAVTFNGDTFTATVTPDAVGYTFDYDAALAALGHTVATLTASPISITTVVSQPLVTAGDAQVVVGGVPAAVDRAPYTLTFGDESWTLEKQAFAELLGFRQRPNGLVALGLDAEKFAAYVDSTIAPTVNQPVSDARFRMENGRVVEFAAAAEGRAVNVDASRAAAEQAWFDDNQTTTALVVDTVAPTVATGSVNNLGISQLLGVGLSHFAGSPANRRHNIAVGAASLNGLLIQPGEEFSLLRALGPIDGSTGYLTELVIKGNKTTPEYGGGLCQIGTTLFRATLSTGLPITQRQNHSYRVVYYEPAGTDATIYDPAPDFRFMNDTGHVLLLQTKISGDTARFEFWGTPDGRRTHFVGQTASDDLYDIKPKVFNVIAPPAAKLIESLDIPVGTKKCTERAHSGATTEFTYQVTYPSGEVKDKVFKSVYRPWQEVCLIGVEKLSEPEEPPPTETSGDGTTPTSDISAEVSAPVDTPSPVPAG